MALIKCSECGNEVSDQANSCPKCGAPLKVTNQRRCAAKNDSEEMKWMQENDPEFYKNYRILTVIASLCMILGIIMGIFHIIGGIICLVMSSKCKSRGYNKNGNGALIASIIFFALFIVSCVIMYKFLV